MDDRPKIYNIALSVHKFVNVFTYSSYNELIIETLKYYQEERGLKIYEWLLTTNHLYLIASCDQEAIKPLIEDFKNYTAVLFFEAIRDNTKDIRSEWLLKALKYKEGIKLWRQTAIDELCSRRKFYAKRLYLHCKPVRMGIVKNGEHYLLSSSAARYGGNISRLELADSSPYVCDLNLSDIKV